MNEPQNLTPKKNEWNGRFVPKHTAKLIKNGIQNNTAPFIPVDGKLRPTLIWNANTGFSLNAREMIPALLVKFERGYETNVVGGWNTLNNSQTKMKQGEKGIPYNFVGKDGKYHGSSHIFAEQTENPDRFTNFVSKNLKQSQNLSNDTLQISSPEVTEYLGAYIAACKSGAKIEVTPEVAEQFKANILNVCNNELKHTNAEKNPEIRPLTDLLFDIDKKSTEIIKSREKELGVKQEQKHEKKIERNQEMGMSF